MLSPLHHICAGVRGFNYQPSYGSSGLELWRRFDARVIEYELGLGKKYFPAMNCIRLWLSWDAFIRDPKIYLENFEITLKIAERFELQVMPVLFNRWHDKDLDYGGIYIDHFLPGASWVQQEGMFRPFLEAIIGSHSKDERILAWDLCNEPYAYNGQPEEFPEISRTETTWLRGLYRECKELGASAPVTVSIHPGVTLAMVEDFSDILSVHPYYVPDPRKPEKKLDFERLLDGYLELSSATGKPLLATETCWGAVDDAIRTELIRYTLGELRKRDIGFLCYLLHHSLVADAHREEFGPVGRPGNLSFIEEDGRLRSGHGIWNNYV